MEAIGLKCGWLIFLHRSTLCFDIEYLKSSHMAKAKVDTIHNILMYICTCACLGLELQSFEV